MPCDALSFPIKLFILTAALLSFGAAAKETPFLRLNPMMHTEMINRIGVSVDLEVEEIILATASDDKTVRLWELPEGRLYRILRPPIDTGNEGKLFALALSSDAYLVAAGGWTKGDYKGFGNHKVYLFDASNGEIIKRLSGLDNAILHLNFSPQATYRDGKLDGYLAAALAGQNGIRVWNLADFTEAYRDMEYAGDSYWVEFSPDGKHLASSSYDGYVRLYTPIGLRNKPVLLTHKVKLSDKNMPFAVRYSPDGEKIAVGFSGGSRIAVLSAQDLSLLYWTPLPAEGNGDVFMAAWAWDGGALYGGGGYRQSGRYALLHWPKAGKSEPTAWPVAANTLTGVYPLPDNRVVYAEATPGWGLLDAKGKPLKERGRETLYFNKLFPEGLLVSEDGQTLEFIADTLESQHRLRFSLPERRLFEAPEEITEAPSTPGDPVEEEKTPFESATVSGASPPSLSIGEVQRLLMKKGYLLGPVDNVLGPKTRAAIQNFQKAAELPATGKLDAFTRVALTQPEVPPEPPPLELLPPILTAPDLEIKSWKNSAQPQLNGKPLSLDKNDTSLCYAFAPNGETLVLGTRFRLLRYDKAGKTLWRQDSPGIVWALNIAANGKLFAAAFSDGTLRWFRLEDGAELLAQYPHADGRRWVAWTPSGMYAASAGADSLLGWHVNNQMDHAADFFPIASLRRHYYQPQNLMSILASASADNTEVPANAPTGEAGDVLEAPRNFPPRVLVQSPQDGAEFSTPEVEVKYRLRLHSQAAPSKLHVLLDGRPLNQVDLSQQPEPAQGSVTLNLPPRTVELALLAEDEYGVSPSEIVLLYWQGEPAPPPARDLYVLAVGIGDYTHESLADLPTANADAAAFAAAWEDQAGAYREVRVEHLADSGYTELTEGLAWLHQAGPDDVVIVLLAGHALQHRDSRKNTYFFLPADAHPKSNAITSTVLLETFDNLPGKVLLFLDTGYFEKLADISDVYSPADIDGFANDLSSPENGLIVFASTVGTQNAQVLEEAGHGAFTAALLEALDGRADLDEDKQLMLSELSTYVSQRVTESTDGKQTPVLAVPETMADFVLGTVGQKVTPSPFSTTEEKAVQQYRDENI